MDKYKEGLTRKQLFIIFMCSIFIHKRYTMFKKSVDIGQQAPFAYKWQIKKEKRK